MSAQNEPEVREAGVGHAPGDEGSESTPLGGVPVGAGGTQQDLAAVRELALRAHPDTVPELVGGATVAEIVASLEPARAAYRRAAEHAGGSAGGTNARPITAGARVPPVPAGDAPRAVVDPDQLSAAEKIRRGLAERQST